MRIRTRTILIMTFQGLTQAAQLIIGIILVRLISKEMLGSYRQVMLVYALIAGILTMQIESSLYYFLPKYGPEKRRDLMAQTLFSTGIISLAIGSAMFFSAGILANNFNNPEIVAWIRVYACFAFFERIVLLMPAFLISLDKAFLSGLFSMSSTILMVLTVVVVFAFGYGITEALLGKIFIEAVFAILGILIMIRYSPRGQWRINKSLLLEQLKYCWPLMATTTIAALNVRLDGLLISTYFSKEVYAVYSTGALELPLIALFTSSLSSAIMPNMVVEADNGRKLSSLNIWHEASRKSSLLIFPAFVFFLFCGHDFIVLLYTQDYEKATWPFLIYLARLPFRIAIYGAIFRAIGYTKPLFFAAIYSFTANVVIGITLLLAGRHGFLSYIGPSIGTFFGTLISVSYLLTVLQKKIGVSFSEIMRWKELGRIFAISLLCGFLLWLTPVPLSNLIIKLAVRCAIYTFYFVSALLLTKNLHADEFEMIYLPLKMMRKSVLNKKI